MDGTRQAAMRVQAVTISAAQGQVAATSGQAGSAWCDLPLERSCYGSEDSGCLPARIGINAPVAARRDHRRAHQHSQRRRPRFEQPMLTIRQRHFDPLDRSQAGHWEGDLIIGKDQGSAIGILVEPQTPTVRLLHMPCRDGGALHDALNARMGGLPPALLRSITWDQETRWPATSRSPGRWAFRSFLRLALALAARLQREHERPAARLLPQRHRPEHPPAPSPARRRERTQ